ncbi:MAG: hypothetical protein QW057_07960 [Candidatus Bathyarchaeia archaeon]
MVKTTIEIDDAVWRRFSLLTLRERGERKKNQVIAELIKEHVERRESGDPRQFEYILRIEELREAFLKALDGLVKDPRYRGKYVAFLERGVVDSDEEKARLARRVYAKHGYIPIYIDLVAPGERRVEAPSPELAER